MTQDTDETIPPVGKSIRDFIQVDEWAPMHQSRQYRGRLGGPDDFLHAYPNNSRVSLYWGKHRKELTVHHTGKNRFWTGELESLEHAVRKFNEVVRRHIYGTFDIKEQRWIDV